MSSVLTRLIYHVVGYLYPSYKTFKAVESGDNALYTQWLTYWIVSTSFFTFETVFDVVFSYYLPFYSLCKVFLFLWLVSPYSRGATVVYKKFLQPYLTKYEKDIDLNVSRLKSHVSEQITSIGKRAQETGVEMIAAAVTRTAEDNS